MPLALFSQPLSPPAAFGQVFLYLNDVDRSNGAHRYVPGSFKNLRPVAQYHNIKQYHVGRRFTDAEIEEMYPGKPVYIEGAAGTILIEDTRGFHAGTPLQLGFRNIVQWEFAASGYRYSRDAWVTARTPAASLNAQTKRAIALFPRVFERYTFVV